MKKVESVLIGSPKCGKSRPLTLFPHFLFGLLFLVLPKDIFHDGGEGDASDSHLSVEVLSRSLLSTNLTFDIII